MYRISFWGSGNVAYRLSIALKAVGFAIPFICCRNNESAQKLVHILNKNDNNPHNIQEITEYTNDFNLLADSDIVIIAVSDDAIKELAQKFYKINFLQNKKPVILHTSGASSLEDLDSAGKYGVLYPLMTLSKVKPVDFKLVPFLIEFSVLLFTIFLSNLSKSLLYI